MGKPVQNIWLAVMLVCLVVLPVCPVMAVSVQVEEIVTLEDWEKAFKVWDSARNNWHDPQTAPNGLPFPASYRDWKVLSVSHREDRNSIRVILGNDVAMLAAREKRFKPWPEDTILVKVLWRQRRLPTWPESWVPADLLGVAMMYKNKEHYSDTLGWGFSLWKKEGLKLPKDFDATVQDCVRCHMRVEKSDYVFTYPAVLP